MNDQVRIDGAPQILRQPQFPVAIVGYSYRMPGGIRTDDDFWRLLSERDIVREPITERYGKGYSPIGTYSGPGRLASQYEGLIRDDEEWLFDRGLFGMSHTEMLATDPQLRMLLSCAWESIEHSGWSLNSLRNSSTGVFVGAQVPAVANWRPMLGLNEFVVTSISLAMLANRISYHFNLMGPSITHCTACSASLTALHAAINALRSGDCDSALVGSVHYLGLARISIAFNSLGVISPDGKCHSFDAGANGYMRSEGAFMFGLKPLENAERDGDNIYAVIEATAVNAAGTADGSEGIAPGRYITAPTSHAQVDLMRTARNRAGRLPTEIDYVEAHATGTVVGDRIEGNAISEAFEFSNRDAPLRIASVKSNVGHMEAASFHCGLLKVLMMMQRRTFAPNSKTFMVPNPEIDFDRCPMQVQTTCEPFPERPVTVGINSFGFGGANGHCVVSEYSPSENRIWSIPLNRNSGFMVPVSARTQGLLTQQAQQLLNALGKEEIDLYTLAGNLSRRRTHFAARTSFAALNQQDLIEAMESYIAASASGTTPEEGEKRVAMVFSGQGTQWSGCGRALYDTNSVFRRTIDAIEELWLQHTEISLREACFSASQEELDEVRLAQPVIFMIQCGLVEMLKTWGIYPDCVVGHSSGEIAAAYASGALSLADATQLVFHRATLQQRLAGSGRMLAVGLDRAGMEDLLVSLGVSVDSVKNGTGQVEIACENAPANTVVCGKEDDLRPVMAELDSRNLQNVLLPGNIAFHSSAMDSIKDDALSTLTFLDDLSFDPDTPFVSSVTGKVTSQLDSAYWWTNIRQPVQFSAAMEIIQQDFRPDIVLEIAPHSALQPTIAQCLEGNTRAPATIPTLMRNSDVRLSFLESLGALFEAGADLDFAAQYPKPRPISHLLPGHPKEEQTTMDPMCDNEMFVRQGEYSHGPLVGHKIPSGHLLFEARLSQRDFPWLTDHRVHHAPIMPAAGYIELVLEALEGSPVHFEEVELLQPCPIPSKAIRLQTSLVPTPSDPEELTFTISSCTFDIGSESIIHCRGKVRRISEPVVKGVAASLDEFNAQGVGLSAWFTGSKFYERLEAIIGDAYDYGPQFQTTKELHGDIEGRILKFEIEVDEELWASGQAEGYLFFPPLLDGGLQSTLYHLMLKSDLFAIPQRARNVTFLKPPTSPRVTVIYTRDNDIVKGIDERGQPFVLLGELSIGSIAVYDTNTGSLLAYIDKYCCFNSNPKWNDLPLTKHVISWQPKFIPSGQALIDRLPEGEIGPEALLAALEKPVSGQRYACHVIEFTGSLVPEQTIFAECSNYLGARDSQTEFWLVSDDEERAKAHYQAFHNHDAALRCVCLGPDEEPALNTGLLRQSAAEILFLHDHAATLSPQKWTMLRQLVVTGGLALVMHEEGSNIVPDAGWTVVRSGRRATLLQAPQNFAGDSEVATSEDLRWVLGGHKSLATDWIALLDSPEAVKLIPEEASTAEDMHTLDIWSRATDVSAIDFFCGDDPEDPTGEHVVARLIAFVQTLVLHRIEASSEPCRLTVITRKAAYETEDPRGCGLWGAVRSMSAELAEEANMNFRLVDLGESDDLVTLASLTHYDLRERELAIRQQQLWVPRLISLRDRFTPLPDDAAANFRLSLENPGQISGLQMKTYEPAQLGPSDVEIDVAATALNFRDVVVTLGLLPVLAYERSALGREVGIEGSGVITRIGNDVELHRVGDEVIFTEGGCISNQIIVDQHRVFTKPSGLDMEEAAAILTVYVTAYYSLIYLARLRKGQRVLIHSAMGGVGQAAIALAKYVGAEIYATAGSEEKREQLLAMGVTAAFDSHSFDWYDELMAATDGEGVDVTLNSLAGRHIDLCLQSLRQSGWLCEIGKVDIYADSDLSMRVFRKNLRFAAIDMDRLMIDDPLLSYEISKACLDLIDQGVVPLLPITVFPYADYTKALRQMTAGQHVGKLVLKAPGASVDKNLAIADTRPFFNPDATYLVTGGFGGFGKRVLSYLVACGVRHITMMDRNPERGRDDDWVRQSTTLMHMNVDLEIDIVPGDVSREEDVRRCVAQMQKPLKGVFHLAGVLDDRFLTDTTADSVRLVYAPKADGALNIHRATADIELDYFVMFSSIAASLGNLGQTNYSAANAFLDGFVAWRRRQGLPALSYSTAAVAETGMAAENIHVLRMMRAVGTPPVSTDSVISNLDYALRSPVVEDHLLTIRFTRPAWTFNSPDYMRSGRLMNNQDGFEIDKGGQFSVETIVAQIAEKVAELCGHDEGNVDDPLSSFGLTSISVAELGTFIQSEFSHQVSALELMTTASCLSLATAIVHGDDDGDEIHAETDEITNGDASQAVVRQVRRVPSVFASAFEDHFPKSPGSESSQVPVYQI